MDNSLLQFKDAFVVESSELLEDMEARLLNLRPGCDDKEELNAIFRCAHTIKGTGAALGFEVISKFTHVLETLLDLLRDGKLDVTEEIIEALLSSHDILQKLITAVKEDIDLAEEFTVDIITKLKDILNNKQKSVELIKESPETKEITEESKSNLYMIKFVPKKDLFLSGNEPLLIIRGLKKLGVLESECHFNELAEFSEIDPKLCYIWWDFKLTTDKTESDIMEVFEFVENNSEININIFADAPVSNDFHIIAKTAEKSENIAEHTTKKVNTPTIRVDIDKIDKLVNMVGELVIAQSMIYAQIKNLPIEESENLIHGLNDLFSHSRNLQEGVMAIRMQPVKTIFSRFPRIIRDLASQLDKNVKLETYGETTEIDKTVIEMLSDPLTHMIRNSVDHGIEMPDVRIKNGKDAVGIIKLEASNKGGKIYIEISDNGAGINREKVLAKAKSKDLVSEYADLSNEEIDNLIFAPGLSTAQSVTDISGRGVGMDVVKRNIEVLGGKIEIKNNPGFGSRFIISLPLTLAILDGMIVRTGQENFVIPISHIMETMNASNQKIERVTAGKEVVNIRGDFVPIIYLKKIFNITYNVSEYEKSLIVLLESDNQKFGLVVDELVGQQQVVIKNITENTNAIDGISGATILGDGKVSFILDVPKLPVLHSRFNTVLI